MSPDIPLKKILVIDDDLEMRLFLSAVLESSGFQPLAIAPGEDTLRVVATQKPSLIILDPMTVEETGMGIYETIRSNQLLGKIPVILVSSIDENSFLHFQRIKAPHLAAGPTRPEGFLAKPPEAEDLIGLVSRLIT